MNLLADRTVLLADTVRYDLRDEWCAYVPLPDDVPAATGAAILADLDELLWAAQVALWESYENVRVLRVPAAAREEWKLHNHGHTVAFLLEPFDRYRQQVADEAYESITNATIAAVVAGHLGR